MPRSTRERPGDAKPRQPTTENAKFRGIGSQRGMPWFVTSSSAVVLVSWSTTPTVLWVKRQSAPAINLPALGEVATVPRE